MNILAGPGKKMDIKKKEREGYFCIQLFCVVSCAPLLLFSLQILTRQDISLAHVKLGVPWPTRGGPFPT